MHAFIGARVRDGGSGIVGLTLERRDWQISATFFLSSVCPKMRLQQFPALAPVKVCVYLTVLQARAQTHVDMPHVCVGMHDDPV